MQTDPTNTQMNSSHNATAGESLEIDPQDWESQQIYFLTTGLVIPRPIGWISSLSEDGLPNLAPYSFFNAVSPDHVAFSSSGNNKDSINNVRKTREFVANIVTQDIVERMNFTSTNFPPQHDEFEWAGLTRAASKKVKPFRVAEAKAHLECEVVEIVQAGVGQIVIGKIVHFHVDAAVWKNGRVDPELLNPVCRLSGAYYATMGEVFKIERPFWEEVEGSKGTEKMPRLSNGPES